MMTIKECYDAIGANYDDVIRRIGSEERLKRFLLKLPDDNSFSVLCAALETEEYGEAFRAAHSLKGICLNLGLTPLAESSSALTEELRSGKPAGDIAPLVQRVKNDYQKTLNALELL